MPQKLHNNCVSKFDKQARQYKQHAKIQLLIGQQLLTQCQGPYPKALRILDLGCGAGTFTTQLCQKFANCKLISIDLAYNMCAQTKNNSHACINANAELLPLANNSIDIIFCNLTLQWCQNPEKVINEIARVLDLNGELYLSTLGPKTLIELKQSFAKLDKYDHINEFCHPDEIYNMLSQSTLCHPIMHNHPITIEYQTLHAIIQDIRQIGANNITSPNKNHGLTTKAKWQQLSDIYQQTWQTPNQLLPATYDAIYVHAKGSSTHNTNQSNINIPVINQT